MSGKEFFEDFSVSRASLSNAKSGNADQLASYESGFQAGWDDAMAANQENSNHISASLARNLEAIDFTMAEAQSQLLCGLKPILDEVGKTLLPEIRSLALRDHISKEIENCLRTYTSSTIALVVSEADQQGVKELLSRTPETSKIALEVKSTLAEGQAYITCAQTDRKIDISQSIQEIISSFDSILDPQEQEKSHAG